MTITYSKSNSYCILYMESEAIVFCDEETQRKVPADVLETIKQRNSVEINAYPGRYVIPQTGIEGSNFWAKKELIEYVNYYKSQPEFQWCWQKDQNVVLPYDEESNRLIEDSFNRREATT